MSPAFFSTDISQLVFRKISMTQMQVLKKECIQSLQKSNNEYRWIPDMIEVTKPIWDVRVQRDNARHRVRKRYLLKGPSSLWTIPLQPYHLDAIP